MEITNYRRRKIKRVWAAQFATSTFPHIVRGDISRKFTFRVAAYLPQPDGTVDLAIECEGVKCGTVKSRVPWRNAQ